MNLFKKTTAAIALVTLVSGIFSTGVSAYSTSEVEAANALAEANIIVNHSSNSAAYNLDQNVLRQEIAAVARGIAGLDKETTYAPVFSDVTETTPNTWAWSSVNALANAGLVAKNAEFRPEANISKAEAVGMVVKAAFGSEYAFDATLGTSWQEQVVAFAVANGVVSSFTNYDTAATRGFVFEAGSNAMASGQDDMGNILDELLGGLTGDDTTTTDTTNTGTTTDTTVKAGDVEVSLNPMSAANGTQIPGTGSILFAKVDFTAGSADVSVDTVELNSLGLAAVPTGTKVWFEKNGKRLSGKASFSSERLAVTSFAPALVVKAGSTETLDLYVELATVSGNDFQFSGKITASSANNNNGSFVTSTLRTANYAVAGTDFTANSSATTSVNQSANSLELGRFKLINQDASPETRDLKFQTVTFRQLGNGDLFDLSNIVLERNGVVVSSEVAVSGKDLTFVVNDIIKDGTTADYYVKAVVETVQNNGGDSYQLSLRNTTDISVVEVLNGFRSTVNNTGAAFSTYTITGADVTFARDSSVELSKTYAKGSSDVVFMQGTITAKQAITLEDPTLTFNGTGSDLFSTLYLQIGSSTMTWSATATGTAQFSGLATVNGSTTVKLYAKLKDTANAVDVKFDDLRLTSFTSNGKAEYVSNQNEVKSSVGSISGVNVTVGNTNLSVTRIDNMGATKVAVGSKAVLANEVSAVVTQGNDVNISNVTYAITASGTYSNNVFATLFIDGTAVDTKTLSGATVTFNNSSKVISKTATKLAVKLDLSDAYDAGDFSMKLTALNAVDNSTSVTAEPSSFPTSATLTIAAAKGTLSTSDSNPKASLLLAGDRDQKVLAFRVKASNDTIKLRDLVFTGTSLDNLSNFRVVSSSNEVVASSTTSNSGSVTFTSIDTTNTIAMDVTNTYYLVADVNTNVSGATFSVNLDGAQSKVKSTNGTVVNMDTTVTASVASNVHAIEENKAVVAKASNSSKDLSTSALRFTVTASGKDSVTLNSATFDNVLSGYTGATTLTVYKDTVSVSNIVGTGSVTGPVTFTGNKTVDAGSTNTYIVVIDGTIDANANTPSWTVRLTNVLVGSINANAYTNMGEFPITETK
ncbi:MAG: S-layer homology domain-containing protein [Candidatus Gracilibacteria bacterium]|nr:S-layer homology domain-containing protein [Candidatus Gracilibacteria bacterium]